MTDLAPKVLFFIAFLYVYIGGIRGRPNILEDTARGENQKTFEESDLLKRSKAKSGGQGKDHKEIKGKKKQVIDAYHLGPYHHGHPWGTVSQWPGFHWGGHPSRHAGWTGYPSLGGWHKSHISKKSPKKAAQKASLKRRMLPTFAFPAYGYAYPSLGFAAVPFTPSPIPWGHAHYRTKVPEKSSTGHTRSSVKHTEANKRWWPGYMGGWGGWGLGNEGYPGWGALGDWGRGYDFGGFGHGWGMLGTGLGYHPFLRAEIPQKQSKKDKAEKRWWPGYMGGWGGWGLGNSGYPGWGPLGGFWGHGWGPYAYGHGYGLGIGRGHAFRSDLPSRDDKEEQSPKRQLIHEPFAGTDFPWSGYGPFADYQYPYFGHSQYIPYPFAPYGDSIPFYGFGPSPVLGYGFPGDHGFFKSKIPEGKSKKMQKELKKEEKATGRHFVNNFHPGRMGWGGALYSGNGYHAAFPLLGAHTYGLYGAGFYGPYGPPYGAFGPYSRSGIPGSSKENPQSRQVINYNPGCCGWGGCVYPGCGYIGGWTWPLPCHFRHCGCGCPCWTRSKAPRKQSLKEEKGKSRQDIESPVEEESENGKEDPRTRPHLEGADLLNSEMQSLAMGFPGIEKLQTPMGSSSNQGVQGFNDQEIDANGEHSSPEPAETSESMAGMNPFEGANALRAAAMGSMGEQQVGQQQTAEDLMSTFSTSPSNEGEAPVEAFGETGNPNMYPTEAEEQATEAASRRADIPGEMEKELIKKQAVAYPYHYLYPGFTMAHGVNPYYHYTPLNYPQHVMAYPSTYPLANTYAPLYPAAHAGLIPQAQELPLHDRPSHSIHVGAPNVNVDVHTTREHVAPSPEKVKSGKLKQLFGEFSTKLKPKSRHHQSSHGKKVMKRQISPLLSPIMSRPMGLSPLRYPVSNPQPGLTGARMFPSLQPAQPFDIRAISRSGLPAMSSPAMGMSPLGFSASRAPQMRSALTPSQMAFSRQLSSVTGISIPIAAQPGMGIVGMASRKKRSPSKKPSKKKDKTTKRQFLAAMPQTLSSGGLPWLSSPESPFSGAAFPSLPFAQPQQPLSFKQPMMPAIRSRMAPTGLTTLRMAGLQANRMPMMLSPFSGFPSPQNNPFFKVPQFQNANFFSGSPNGPWAPSAPMREPMSEMPNAPMREPISETPGFSQFAERRPEPMIPETQQMNGEQFAGFNPSSFGLSEPQPPAMFSQEGPGSEGPQLPMVPQKEMASFFQVPGEGAMTESPTFNMQPGLAALKKSSVPDKKNIKGKSSKSRKQITL